MTKLIIRNGPAAKAGRPPKLKTVRKIGADGKRTTLYVVRGKDEEVMEQIKTAFVRTVVRARRDNAKIAGSADGFVRPR